MADILKRHHIPDKKTKIVREAESGIKGKWERIFHPEERDQHGEPDIIHQYGDMPIGIHRSETPYDFKRVSGGGTGALDDFFKHPESADPELMVLYNEFLDESPELVSKHKLYLSKHKVNSILMEDFSYWLDSEEIPSDKKREFKSEKYFELELKDSKKREKLYSIWDKKDTKVVFIFSDEDRKAQHILFKGKDKEGEPVKVGFEWEKFKDQIEGLEKRSLPYPGKGCREKFFNTLKQIRFLGKKLKTDDLEVLYPTTNLSYRKDKAYRQITSTERKGTRSFYHTWINGDIEAIGIGFNNGEIGSIALKATLNGKNKVVELPFDLFKNIFDIRAWNGSSNGKAARGVVIGPMKLIIAPGENPRKIEDVIHSLKIGGRKLEDTPVVLVNL